MTAGAKDRSVRETLRVSYDYPSDLDLEVAVQMLVMPMYWPTWFGCFGMREANFLMLNRDAADSAADAVKIAFGGHVRATVFW